MLLAVSVFGFPTWQSKEAWLSGVVLCTFRQSGPFSCVSTLAPTMSSHFWKWRPACVLFYYYMFSQSNNYPIFISTCILSQINFMLIMGCTFIFYCGFQSSLLVTTLCACFSCGFLVLGSYTTGWNNSLNSIFCDCIVCALEWLVWVLMFVKTPPFPVLSKLIIRK